MSFDLSDPRLPPAFLADAKPCQKFRAQAMWARYALRQELRALEYKPELNEIVIRCVADIAALRIAMVMLPILHTLTNIERDLDTIIGDKQ